MNWIFLISPLLNLEFKQPEMIEDLSASFLGSLLGRQGVVLTVVLCSLLFPSDLLGQDASLVSIQNGGLVYSTFPMTGQTAAVNVIPDFSHAGYKGGGVVLPNVPVVKTLSPSGGEDLLAIQNAIDSVSSLPLNENGFRGAVLLTAGHYQVNDQLFIRANGVVLRGEGQGVDGTVLHANKREKHNFINVTGTGKGIGLDTTTLQTITSPYVPVGTYSFTILDGSRFTVGDTISVRKTPNQTWIDTLGMGAALCEGVTRKCTPWTISSYTVDNERVVTNITGNTMTVNLPIMDVIESQFGGGEVYKASVPGRIEHVGIENLRIESYFASDEDENHGWSAIRLSRTVNSWVKKVTGQYFGYGTVNIGDQSNFNTIEECAAVNHKSQIKGGRRYSFVINDGMGNLVQRCYTRDGRHDFAMGARITGPNVFVDNYSTDTHADIGPHQRWTVGTLFDNIRGGQIRVRNRLSSGTGHGWAGNTTMFWNLNSYAEDIVVESPEGGMNWGIGCIGQTQGGDGYWESWGQSVLPRSLYYQQLEDRLGVDAVINVTIPEQRKGNIYKMLADWAGEGDLKSSN